MAGGRPAPDGLSRRHDDTTIVVYQAYRPEIAEYDAPPADKDVLATLLGPPELDQADSGQVPPGGTVEHDEKGDEPR